MTDIFKPYRKFLSLVHKALVERIRSGKCSGKQIKWNRKEERK